MKEWLTDPAVNTVWVLTCGKINPHMWDNLKKTFDMDEDDSLGRQAMSTTVNT
jgi:hypothetical protein